VTRLSPGRFVLYGCCESKDHVRVCKPLPEIDKPCRRFLLRYFLERSHWLSPFLMTLLIGRRDLTILSISERQTA
jgi:hypothetical protein